MTIVYILLGILFLSLCFCLFTIFFIKNKCNEELLKYQEKLSEYDNKFEDMKNSIDNFVINNSKKYNELILRCNSFEKVLETFNNGFRARGGYF